MPCVETGTHQPQRQPLPLHGGPRQFISQPAKKHHLHQQKRVQGLAITALCLVQQPDGSRAWEEGRQQKLLEPTLVNIMFGLSKCIVPSMLYTAGISLLQLFGL